MRTIAPDRIQQILRKLWFGREISSLLQFTGHGQGGQQAVNQRVNKWTTQSNVHPWTYTGDTQMCCCNPCCIVLVYIEPTMCAFFAYSNKSDYGQGIDCPSASPNWKTTRERRRRFQTQHDMASVQQQQGVVNGYAASVVCGGAHSQI